MHNGCGRSSALTSLSAVKGGLCRICYFRRKALDQKFSAKRLVRVDNFAVLGRSSDKVSQHTYAICTVFRFSPQVVSFDRGFTNVIVDLRSLTLDTNATSYVERG